MKKANDNYDPNKPKVRKPRRVAFLDENNDREYLEHLDRERREQAEERARDRLDRELEENNRRQQEEARKQQEAREKADKWWNSLTAYQKQQAIKSLPVEEKEKVSIQIAQGRDSEDEEEPKFKATTTSEERARTKDWWNSLTHAEKVRALKSSPQKEEANLIKSEAKRRADRWWKSLDQYKQRQLINTLPEEEVDAINMEILRELEEKEQAEQKWKKLTPYEKLQRIKALPIEEREEAIKEIAQEIAKKFESKVVEVINNNEEEDKKLTPSEGLKKQITNYQTAIKNFTNNGIETFRAQPLPGINDQVNINNRQLILFQQFIKDALVSPIKDSIIWASIVPIRKIAVHIILSHVLDELLEGEPHAVNLQEHYYSDSGMTIYLSQFPETQKLIRNSVKAKDKFGRSGSIEGRFIKSIQEGKGLTFSNSYKMQDIGPQLYDFGSVTLSGYLEINNATPNSEGSYDLDATIHYGFRDYYADPYDHFNLDKEDVDYGVPFYILDAWDNKVKLSVSKEVYENNILKIINSK